MNAQRPNVFILVLAAIGTIVLGVFLLHVVAVGGIYAFNSSKASNVNSLKASPEVAPTVAASFYTVRKGDTATSIAHSFGLATEELLKVNHITDPKKLQPGQTLKVRLGKS